MLHDILWKLDRNIPLNPPPIPEELNFFPGYVLAAQAAMGTAWWLATFLLYFKNNGADSDLTALNGGTIFPIGWFWERISEANGIYNMFALALFFNFFFYGVVSAVEFVAYFFYLNGEPYFAAFWFSTIGYYGSLFGLPLPWIFAAVYLNDQLKGVTTIFPATWDIFLLIVDLIMWVVISAAHIYYVPKFLVHVAALPPLDCDCNLPKVEPVEVDASEELKAENARANTERDYLCLLQCPPRGKACNLDKAAGQSDADYEAACAALAENSTAVTASKSAAIAGAAAMLNTAADGEEQW